MSYIKYLMLLSLLSFFVACVDTEPVASSSDEQSIDMSSDLVSFDGLAKGGRHNHLRVMTRNIYIGTDVDVVLSADSASQIPLLATQAFQGLINTNFPERAVALAREIYFTRPHLIGLQEVTLVRLQTPGDAVVGGTVPAEEVFMDYLEIFMATLKSMGLHYEVAAKVQNVDVEIPFISNQDPLTFSDVRVTDHDVILVRKDVKVSDVVEQNFQYNLPIASLGIEITRGYTAIDAKVGGQKYRFVNTHLEPFHLGIQLLQMQELLAALADEKLPVVMVGDFNSQAPVGDTYNYILANGYADIWNQNHLPWNPDGFTFGHDADLLNAEAAFYERIDHIYVRDGMNRGNNIKLRDNVFAIVVGDEQFNRTPSGLWPSDHGGVVSMLSFYKHSGKYLP